MVFSNDHDAENEELLNPALSIDEFLSKYHDYAEKSRNTKERDDLSSLLYFHTGNFKGIDEEYKSIERIIDLLSITDNKENLIINQNILKDKESNQTKDEAEKEWIRAMVRLSILGVVKDYTYDYSSNFCIELGSIDKKEIVYFYRQYIIKNEKGKARREEEKITAM